MIKVRHIVYLVINLHGLTYTCRFLRKYLIPDINPCWRHHPENIIRIRIWRPAIIAPVHTLPSCRDGFSGHLINHGLVVALVIGPGTRIHVEYRTGNGWESQWIVDRNSHRSGQLSSTAAVRNTHNNIKVSVINSLDLQRKRERVLWWRSYTVIKRWINVWSVFLHRKLSGCDCIITVIHCIVEKGILRPVRCLLQYVIDSNQLDGIPGNRTNDIVRDGTCPDTAVTVGHVHGNFVYSRLTRMHKLVVIGCLSIYSRTQCDIITFVITRPCNGYV